MEITPIKTKKRYVLVIDKLLERDEYVDYWAYKWSDLMLVLFVLFAVLYSYVISHRDLTDTTKDLDKNAPVKTPINKSPIRDITKPPEVPK